MMKHWNLFSVFERLGIYGVDSLLRLFIDDQEGVTHLSSFTEVRTY